MSIQELAERMGATTSDAEAAAMIEILEERGIHSPDQLSDEEFFALIPDAIERGAQPGAQPLKIKPYLPGLPWPVTDLDLREKYFQPPRKARGGFLRSVENAIRHGIPPEGSKGERGEEPEMKRGKRCPECGHLSENAKDWRNPCLKSLRLAREARKWEREGGR